MSKYVEQLERNLEKLRGENERLREERSALHKVIERLQDTSPSTPVVDVLQELKGGDDVRNDFGVGDYIAIMGRSEDAISRKHEPEEQTDGDADELEEPVNGVAQLRHEVKQKGGKQ